jgi:hypothetical protein
VYKFWNKFKNKINHGFALTYNTLRKNNANEFEIYLLGFLLSTNAKVKKMTTVSAVMVEIVEMYIFQIHLHYFFLACQTGIFRK